MKIRVLGGGWYGCHIACHLIGLGHEVKLHEIKDAIFLGASGANPARLHLGFHYPRSKATRDLSQANYRKFIDAYGHLTRAIPVNIYAVAKDDSQVDFANYVQTLRGEVEFITVEKPGEFGITNVEGAVMCGERVCLVDLARDYFTGRLRNHLHLSKPPGALNDPAYDWTIDCTFCAYNDENVDRYEPCVTHLLAGPGDKSITIMDGPFPSLYAFGRAGLATLTSAKFTPLGGFRSYIEAKAKLEAFRHSLQSIKEHLDRSLDLMEFYYPMVRNEYRQVDCMTAVRAMPRSGADSRLFDIVIGKRSFGVRAGKIDAIFATAERIGDMLADLEAGREIRP